MADMYFVKQPRFDDSRRLRIEEGGPFPAGLHAVLYEGTDGDLAKEIAENLRRGELVRYVPDPANQQVLMIKHSYANGKVGGAESQGLSTVNPVAQIAKTLTGSDYTLLHGFARSELHFLRSLDSTK